MYKFPQAKFKSFETRSAAEDFIAGYASGVRKAGNSVFRSSYSAPGSAQSSTASGDEVRVLGEGPARVASSYVVGGASDGPKKTITKKRSIANRSGKKPIARQPFWWSDEDAAKRSASVVDLTSGEDLEETVVWTDGSCLGNQLKNGRRKAGVGAFFGDNDPRNVSMKLPGEMQTNQRAEVFVGIFSTQLAISCSRAPTPPHPDARFDTYAYLSPVLAHSYLHECTTLAQYKHTNIFIVHFWWGLTGSRQPYVRWRWPALASLSPSGLTAIIWFKVI